MQYASLEEVWGSSFKSKSLELQRHAAKPTRTVQPHKVYRMKEAFNAHQYEGVAPPLPPLAPQGVDRLRDVHAVMHALQQLYVHGGFSAVVDVLPKGLVHELRTMVHAQRGGANSTVTTVMSTVAALAMCAVALLIMADVLRRAFQRS